MFTPTFRNGLLAVLCAALVLIHCFAPSALAQGTAPRSFLPILQASDSADLGLALSNPTVTEATVTLTARSYSGEVLAGAGINNPATITLPASGQRALRASEIFGSGIVGRSGWVELESSTLAVKGFFLVFDSRLSFIDGAELPTSGASRLIFPKVSAANGSTTNISFVHIGANQVRFAAVSFYENSGRLLAREYMTLEPRSGFSGAITDLLPGAAGAEGYVVVETAGTPFSSANDTLIGFETYRVRADAAALNAIAENAAVRNGFLPHLAQQGNYITTLALINYTGGAQTVRITAAGLEVGGASHNPASVTVERTIPPFGRIEETADRLFSLSGAGLITGYITWETQGNTRGVAGYLDYGTTDGLQLAAVPAQGAGYSDLFFSHVAEGAGFYTGLAFLNTGSQSSTINLEAFDRDGRSVGKVQFTLSSGERRSRLLRELIANIGTQLGGYVRVNATRPVFAFQLFGSALTSQNFLANVSAQGVQLQPQLSGRTVNASAGATVLSRDTSSTIAIPPGALSTDTAISLNTPAIVVPPPSSTSRTVAAIDAQPSGTTFNIPVRLTFPLAVQLDPGTEISVLILNTTTLAYEDSGFKAVVDETGRTASALVTHFTVFVLPVNTEQFINVTGLSPASGRTGSTVTITGTGFSATAGNNIVTFAGPDNTAVRAEVTAASETSLTVTVPTGAISGNVIIKAGSKTSTGIVYTIIDDQPKPGLSQITPNGAAFGATTVDLQLAGTNFRAASIVRVDGVAVTSTFIDSTLMFATLASGQLGPGIHSVTVFTPAPGGGESEAKEFTVGYPVPKIASISPSEAFINQTVDVTINGTDFFPNSTVIVNGGAVTPAFIDSKTLKVSLTATTPAILLITVSNPAPGGGPGNSGGFAFREPPVGSITFITTSGVSATVGTAIPITVEVRNTSNALLANQAVAFAITAGNGSVSSSSVITGSDGRASVTLTLGTIAGLNKMTASAGSVTVTFEATGTAAAASKVTLSRSPTTITAGGTGSTVTARIEDQYGNLRTDATNGVTFSVSAGSGTLSPASANAVAGVATTTFTSVTSGSNSIQGAATGLTSGTTTVTVSPAAAANLAIVAGNNQNGRAGVALSTPLKVRITDAFGNVVPGVSVTFSVLSGGGSVTPASAVTDANGEAQTTSTPGGSLGTQAFRAASAGLTSVDFAAAITAGLPAKLALVSGAPVITAGTTANLTITVQDAFSNTVTDAASTLALSSNPATSVTLGAITALNQGVATSTFYATAVGSYTVTASSAGLTSASVSETVNAAAASVLAMVSGDSQTGVKGTQLPSALVAQVTDAFNNPISGVTVTFAVTSGGGSVTPTTANTGTNGQASTSATLGNVTGQHRFTATVAGLTGSPVTFTAQSINAPPAALVQIGSVTSPATVATTQTLTVEVRDVGGNPIPEVAVAFARTAGDGSVSPASAVTGSDGRASAALTLGNTAGTNTFTATVTGLTPVSVSITGTAGAASQLVKISGDTQTGNTGTQPGSALVVEVRDQFNNAKSGVSVTIAASSGTGTVNPSGAQTSGTDGRVSVNATLGLEAGTQTFTASSAGLASVIFSATVNQAPATTLEQVGSIASSAEVNTTAAFTVRAKDANGNAVPGVTVTFAKTAGNGSVSPGTAVTGSNGQASTTVTIGQTAGTNTFTAAVSGLTGSPVSVSVTGLAGAATQLAKVSGDDQTGAAGGALSSPLVVEARDQFNNAKSGIAATFSVSSGGGSVSVTTAQNTGTDGRAQVTATLGSAVGTHTFTASSTGLTSVVFSATGTLVPANVTKQAGDNQTVAPGISLLTPLKVRVTNSGGIAIPNVTVTWAVASGGGYLSVVGGGTATTTTSTTDSNGDAVITATVGSSTGTNTYTATVSGLTPVTFTATSGTLAVSPTSITVNIASGATAIGTYQVTISYDKNLVNLSSSGVAGGSGAGFTGSPTTIFIDNAAGTVTLNHFQMGNSPSGNFTVATLTFTPIRPGSVTLLPSGIVVTDTAGGDVSFSFLSLSTTSLTIN